MHLTNDLLVHRVQRITFHPPLLCYALCSTIKLRNERTNERTLARHSNSIKGSKIIMIMLFIKGCGIIFSHPRIRTIFKNDFEMVVKEKRNQNQSLRN